MTPDQLALILPAIVVMVVGFFTTRHILSKGQLTEAYKYAVWAASAAEEMFVPGTPGYAKGEYVAELLLKRFKISREDARMLVHAAVIGLRQAGIKPEKAPSNVVPISGIGGITPAA